MDTANLGAACYAAFGKRRVLDALATVAPGKQGSIKDALTRQTIDPHQAHIAADRSAARLLSYYDGIRRMLPVTAPERPRIMEWLEAREHVDCGRIRRLYAALSAHTGSYLAPGLALFLQLKADPKSRDADGAILKNDRSIALLPEQTPRTQEAQYRSPFVYMADPWYKVLATEPDWDRLQREIARSNEVWQRERYWVSPGTNTAEYARHNSSETASPIIASFNNIELHSAPVDGWVDAYWGVQSGLSISLPLPGRPGASLLILLTTFVPDALLSFADERTNPKAHYVNPLDSEVATNIGVALLSSFERELEGLGLAAAVLSDIDRVDHTLFAAATKTVTHLFRNQEARGARGSWEGPAKTLVMDARSQHPELTSALEGLEEPATLYIDELEAGLGTRAQQYATEIRELRTLAAKPSPYLPALATVETLLGLIQLRLSPHVDRLEIARAVGEIGGYFIEIPILLLVAIVDNLLERGNVRLAVTIESSDESERQVDRRTLCVFALFAPWDLPLEKDREFLLRPFHSAGGNRVSSGFYLTASVLWSRDGAVEYHRLRDLDDVTDYALIALRFPVTR